MRKKRQHVTALGNLIGGRRYLGMCVCGIKFMSKHDRAAIVNGRIVCESCAWGETAHGPDGKCDHCGTLAFDVVPARGKVVCPPCFRIVCGA